MRLFAYILFNIPPNLKIYWSLNEAAQEFADGAFSEAIVSQLCVSNLKT